MSGFKIIVDGDYACFTRPELKVERVSYDVPTPGAIEGMLKSIYWKPAIRYVVDKIVVFNPIEFMNIRRNEVKDKVSFNDVKKNMSGSQQKDLSIYTSEVRSQRASMILKNVRYGIEFHFELTGVRSEKDDESADKHFCIIKRRLEKGQCFRTPCFGCSEYPIRNIILVENFPLNEISPEIKQLGDFDLGYMLYKLRFKDGGKPVNNDWDKPVFSDSADAVFYRPHMVGGVIDVKKYAEENIC